MEIMREPDESFSDAWGIPSPAVAHCDARIEGGTRTGCVAGGGWAFEHLDEPLPVFFFVGESENLDLSPIFEWLTLSKVLKRLVRPQIPGQTIVNHGVFHLKGRSVRHRSQDREAMSKKWSAQIFGSAALLAPRQMDFPPGCLKRCIDGMHERVDIWDLSNMACESGMQL
jgi:hypothetical protein